MSTNVSSRLGLYLVTDTVLCGARGVAETVRAAVAGGVTTVQLREPELTTRDLCALAHEVLEVLRDTKVPLVVDDRADVAHAVGADGVHVGQDDLDPVSARRLLGSDAIVGLSVTNAEQTATADDLPLETVDYLGVGPVWSTPSKTDAAAPLGLGGLRAAVGATDLPCVAIGGIHAGNAPAVRATGVDGIAVVSAVCAADRPAEAAQELIGGNP